MKQLAWLNASWSTESGVQNLPRIVKYQTEEEEPPLPSVDYRFDLINHLLDMGVVGMGGMAATVISFCEIEAWQRLKQVVLTPWEVGVIRRLSSEYATMSREAEKDIDAPYYLNEITDEDISKHFKMGIELLQDSYNARKKK